MNTEQAQQRSTRQIIAAIFNRAAPTYDHVGPAFFAYFGSRLVELAHPAPGEHVLDLATGGGAALFPASDAVGGSGHVIGIDLAPAMVGATHAEAIARGDTNITLLPMDAALLAFADTTFDAVLCGFAVVFLPDALAALQEWQRVLKPGGWLVLSTWIDPVGPELAWFAPHPRRGMPAVGSIPRPRTQAD